MLQKAMVFTLTAAMLVGTPLTASAAPLNSVFSIADGTNNDDIESGTGTVTNTDTGSGVLNDNDVVIRGISLDRENIEALVGNEETLKAEILLDGELKTGEDGKTVDEDGNPIDPLKKLQSKIRWQILNADKKWDPKAAEALGLAASAGDRTVATLNPKQGTQKELYIRASINNSWYVDAKSGQVKEYANKENATVYEAFAKVTIKEYSTKLDFAWDLEAGNPDKKEEPKVYVKHTIDLSEYLVRTTKTSNDTLTWTSSDTKTATVNAAGVVTVRKAEKPFTIYVSGEKEGASTKWVVAADKNEKGVPASKIIFVDAEGKKITKITPDVDLGGTSADDMAWRGDGKEIKVQVYAKVNVLVASKNDKIPLTTRPDAPNGTNGKYLSKKMELSEGTEYIGVDANGALEKDGEVQKLKVTDEISYSSNKTAVVKVKSSKSETSQDGTVVRTVTLVAPGTVGSAKITAKPSSTKAATLNVKVKATLTSLEIGGLEAIDTVYTGQTYQLEAIRNPKGNTEAVVWTVEKDGGKKNTNAKISKSGLLTISNQKMSDQNTVTIKLATKAKQADKKTPLQSTTITLNVKQSSITGFTVKASDSNDDPIVDVTATPKTSGVSVTAKPAKPKDTLTIPKNVTYTATVKGGTAEGVEADKLASTLSWQTDKPKVVAISKTRGGQTTLTAKGIGKAKITVSGICLDGKNKAKQVKATIEVSVTQPVTSITMKQSQIVMAEKLDKKDNPQKQNVKPEAVFGPKKYDKKSDKILKWTWEKKESNGWGTPTPVLDKHQNNITSAKPSISLPSPKAGDIYRITVETEKGLKATATVSIIKKTADLTIAKGLKEDGTPDLFMGGKNHNSKNTLDLTLGGTEQLKSYVKSGSDWQEQGTDNRGAVTYSVDKKGKSVVTVGNDGKLYAIGVGKAKITAQTLGKKKTLTVNVTLPGASN